jgi:hypothetical protein
MPFSLTWLPGILRGAGLKVAEQPGWLDRGHGDIDPAGLKGVICHHTVGLRTGNMPSLGGLTRGVRQRNGNFLAGPLAQLGLGRDGTYYVIAAGLAHHAGRGSWKGFSGNRRFIGIEAENSGAPDDPWPSVQMDAYQRGVAAILRRIGADEGMCCGHKEYAPLRKPLDPRFDMSQFRARVRQLLAGSITAPPLIAASDDQNRPTLRRGSRGDHVRTLQQKIGMGADGVFGPLTEAKVRQFQRDKGLVPDGIVGPQTWRAIEPG